MDREIKFRVWDEDKKTVITAGEPRRYGVVTNEYLLRHYDYNDIMQYTGLKDKNGQEIYEGDIWKYIDGSDTTICEIEYYNGRFHCIRTEDGGGMIDYYGWTILTEGKVIGNIHENPELI